MLHSRWTFSIANVPVGSNIPLVIVAGKWRRQITIPQTTACTNTVVSGTRFPTNRYPTIARTGLLCIGLWFTASAISGCSGKIPSQNATHTPAGAYTVTVTASDGFLTHSASYQLSVKQR